MRTRRAIVVGGGVGGLAAAVGLQRAGWNTVLFESGPDVMLRPYAGSILTPNARVALRALGGKELMQAAVRSGGRVDSFTVRDRSNRIITRVRRSDVPLGGTEANPLAVGIRQSELTAMMLALTTGDIVAVDTRVVSVEPGEPGGARARVTVISEGEPLEIEADLVVAADGEGSPIRTALFPDQKVEFVGATCIRGIAQLPGERVQEQLVWGPGAEIGMFPVSKQEIHWYGAFHCEPGRETSLSRNLLDALVRTFPEPVRSVVGDTDPRLVARHDQVRQPGLPSFVSGRVVLLGDAAHAMPVYLNQGTALALEDAAVLAQAFSDPAGDVGVALRDYDMQRRPRAQRMVSRSTTFGRTLSMLRSPLAMNARDRTLRATPPVVIGRGLTGVLDWPGPR